MKPGDLAYVNSTSTGDKPWVVELFRTREPVLILEFSGLRPDPHPYIKIAYKGERRIISSAKLKVIET